jgi:hypothetical protein
MGSAEMTAEAEDNSTTFKRHFSNISEPYQSWD